MRARPSSCLTTTRWRIFARPVVLGGGKSGGNSPRLEALRLTVMRSRWGWISEEFITEDKARTRVRRKQGVGVVRRKELKLQEVIEAHLTHTRVLLH